MDDHILIDVLPRFIPCVKLNSFGSMAPPIVHGLERASVEEAFLTPQTEAFASPLSRIIGDTFLPTCIYLVLHGIHSILIFPLPGERAMEDSIGAAD